MDMAEQRFLNSKLRGELLRDEPMRKHTSWRVGGTADCTYRPAGLEDLSAFIKSVPSEQTVYMVGLGSNLLVRDGGIRGVVIFMHAALNDLQISGQVVYAQAGVASPKVARLAATQGLKGAEFLAGIPGTVGGALAMNAGCYGSETWEIVDSVQTIDRSGNVHERTPQDYELGYRHVVLKPSVSNDEEWFIAANLRLEAGDAELARQTIKSFLTRRIVSQPLQQPNAGSVFRNPPNDYAARLIESCGLKGYVIGGAMVSPKHANFIVNTGTARAADIESLIAHVQETVRRERGVQLEREVRIIGEAA